MTHTLAYVRHDPGSCYWQLYCACLNADQPGRGTDPLFATGWLGGITAHESGEQCPLKHDDRTVWTVRRIDETHVEFTPSINAEAGGHFHTGNPTGPIEVRA